MPNGEVNAGGVSVGGSALGGFTAGATATHYTKPFQLFRNPLGIGAIDPLSILRGSCANEHHAGHSNHLVMPNDLWWFFGQHVFDDDDCRN
jgi:hypothetical protein